MGLDTASCRGTMASVVRQLRTSSVSLRRLHCGGFRLPDLGWLRLCRKNPPRNLISMHRSAGRDSFFGPASRKGVCQSILKIAWRNLSHGGFRLLRTWVGAKLLPITQSSNLRSDPDGFRVWPTEVRAHSADSNTSGTVGWLFFPGNSSALRHPCGPWRTERIRRGRDDQERVTEECSTSSGGPALEQDRPAPPSSGRSRVPPSEGLLLLSPVT